MHDLMLEGIQYEKIAGEYWEMQRIEEDAEKGISRYLKNLYEVQNREKSLFDAVEFESEVEKRFAADLDANEHVKLFVKLPRWFKIDTPIGEYNPDWAFVTEREESSTSCARPRARSTAKNAGPRKTRRSLRPAAFRSPRDRLRRGDVARGSEILTTNARYEFH